MVHLLSFMMLFFVGTATAKNEKPSCEKYYLRDSDKSYDICQYDFGKEKLKVYISKECIQKKCEAYKAYEKAFTISMAREPGEMDRNWGTLNCMNMKGTLTWLTNNRQRSGEVRFCKLSDTSFISDYFLDTSRTLW